MDFGECHDDKFFVIAQIQRGQTKLDWRKLDDIRPFRDCHVNLDQAIRESRSINDLLQSALPSPEEMEGAVVRLIIQYPRECETMIDEVSLREYAREAFEFHLVKRPQMEARIRLPADQAVNSLTPQELLEKFWLSSHVDVDEIELLSKLAETVITQSSTEEPV